MIRWRSWQRYWFRPAPVVDLAVLRVLAVGFQLATLIAGDRREVMAGLAVVPDELYRPLVTVRLLLLPFGLDARPSAAVLDAVYWLTLAAGIFALLGLWTNGSLALFALGNVFAQAYRFSFGSVHHPHALLMITLGLLALSPSGRALSIDALRRRLGGAPVTPRAVSPTSLGESHRLARWPLLTVRWLLALAYLSATKSKLESAGLDWANGYTLQYYMLQDGLRWGSALGVWLAQHHTIAWLASWGTLAFEGTFWVTLLVPRLALAYLPAGIAFHTAIYLTQRAPFFQFVVLYAAFVPWAALLARVSTARRWAATRGAGRTGPQVLYDGRCPLCVRSMTALRRADRGRRLSYVDVESPSFAKVDHPGVSLAECRREMHVILPDGTVRRGFFGFRALLRYLPPLWPLLVVFYLPGAALAGPEIYRRVAARRPRCGAGTPAVCARITVPAASRRDGFPRVPAVTAEATGRDARVG